jgi:hypothetical protein
VSTRGDRALEEALTLRRRAGLVSGLRGLLDAHEPGRTGVPTARAPSAEATGAHAGAPAAAGPAPPGGEERCDLCGTTVVPEHRHLLNLVERRIECTCESCFALRGGDPEFRLTGTRTLWLEHLALPEEVWASFQIPIGLAFFMESTTAGCVVALYPSPAGATESELHFASWMRLVELNPVLAGLEADVEGLIVNRLSEPPAYVIAPIDRCYALTGAVKMAWEGISGGSAVNEALAGFFAGLHKDAVTA